MDEKIPFQRKKVESVNLSEWISNHSSEEELREVFLNMDRALKYIHDHGYCILVFYPTEIEVLNNSVEYIQFKKLIELSSDPIRKKEMIKEDIFNSSLVQIGLYSNSLKYLKPDFLRENFDSFSQFIPAGDIPYYRGVVQRGASVYFCEYALEKRNRDLEDLERQIATESGGIGNGKQLIKATNKRIDVEEITNSKINDSIYAQINGKRDAAFINYLVLPTLILILLVILSMILWLFSTL